MFKNVKTQKKPIISWLICSTFLKIGETASIFDYFCVPLYIDALHSKNSNKLQFFCPPTRNNFIKNHSIIWQVNTCSTSFTVRYKLGSLFKFMFIKSHSQTGALFPTFRCALSLSLFLSPVHCSHHASPGWAGLA